MWDQILVPFLKTVSPTLANKILFQQVLEEYETGLREHLQIRLLFWPVRHFRPKREATFEDFYVRMYLQKPDSQHSSPKVISDQDFVHILLHESPITKRASRFLIEGVPGAGKSTLLKYFAIQAFKTKKKFPFWLRLQDFAQKAENFSITSFRKFLSNQIVFAFRRALGKSKLTLDGNIFLLDEQILSLAEQYVEFVLTQGKSLLLLDGLDEMPNKDREKFLQWLPELMQHYPITPIAISSRRPIRPPVGFEIYEIRRFSDRQISEYIFKWFRMTSERDEEAEKRRREMLAALQNAPAQIRELTQTPLLLNLLCIYYEVEESFWISREVQLYRDAADILLEKWYRIKGLPLPQDHENWRWDRDAKEFFLAEVAFASLDDGEELEKERLIYRLRRHLEKIPPDQAPWQTVSRETTEQVLENVVRNYGLLIPDSAERYDFLHRGFQEYYAAYYVETHREDALEALLDRIHETRWQGVFRLLVEKVQDDVVLQEIYQRLLQKKREEAGDGLRRWWRFVQQRARSVSESLFLWQTLLNAELERLETLQSLLPEVPPTPSPDFLRTLLRNRAQFSLLWPSPDVDVDIMWERARDMEEWAYSENGEPKGLWRRFIPAYETVIQKIAQAAEKLQEALFFFEELICIGEPIWGEMNPVEPWASKIAEYRASWSRATFSSENAAALSPPWPVLEDAVDEDAEDIHLFILATYTALSALPRVALSPMQRKTVAFQFLTGQLNQHSSFTRN